MCGSLGAEVIPVQCTLAVNVGATYCRRLITHSDGGIDFKKRFIAQSKLPFAFTILNM